MFLNEWMDLNMLVTAAISLIWLPRPLVMFFVDSKQVRLEFHVHDGALDGRLPPVLVPEGHPDPD
jgi:hypothetical protein